MSGLLTIREASNGLPAGLLWDG